MLSIDLCLPLAVLAMLSKAFSLVGTARTACIWHTTARRRWHGAALLSGLIALLSIASNALAVTSPVPTRPGAWGLWMGTGVYYRLEPSGDPGCYSENRHDCLAGRVNWQKARTLPCGSVHQKEWGITGYDRSGHWCNRTYAALFAEWRVHIVGTLAVLLSTTPQGDPMCESYDGVNCRWLAADEVQRQLVHQAQLDCANAASRRFHPAAMRACFGQGSAERLLRRADLNPLICGPLHLAAYGTDGYAQPTHWCNLARTTPWVRDAATDVYYRLEANGRMSCYSQNGVSCATGAPAADQTRWLPRICTPADALVQTPAAQAPHCNRVYAALFADWKDHRVMGFKGLLANDMFGDTMCWSEDSQTCNSQARTPTGTAGRPIVCGAAHQARWGITGYDQQGHWCNTPRIVYEFKGKPLPFRQDLAGTGLPVIAHYAFPVPAWNASDEPRIAARLLQTRGQPFQAELMLPVRTVDHRSAAGDTSLTLTLVNGAITAYGPRVRRTSPLGPPGQTALVGEYLVGLSVNADGGAEFFREADSTAVLENALLRRNSLVQLHEPRIGGQALAFGDQLPENVAARPGQAEVRLQVHQQSGGNALLEQLELVVGMKRPKSPR